MTALVGRIAEVLARGDYEINEWSGCNGSRWDALPQPARDAALNRFAPVAERVAEALQLTLQRSRENLQHRYVTPWTTVMTTPAEEG